MPTMKPGPVCLLVTVLTVPTVLAGAETARAQVAGGDAAAAAAELFQQGRRALLDQRYPEACARFAESQRLDPKVGTLINLALCENGAGRIAHALARWDEALALARTTADPREPYITAQREAVAPHVPRVAVHLLPEAPAGTQVRLDDEAPLAAIDPTSPIPVDPGHHLFTASATNRASQAFPVDATEGKTVDVVVGPGLELPAESATPLATASSGRVQRIVAYAVAGVGLVGVGIGTVFGAQAISARNDPHCASGVCADEADAQIQRNGVTAGNIATGAFIAGGALVAGGIVLWLTAPRGASTPGRAAAWLHCAPLPGGGILAGGAAW
jgi:hypothetical protein